MTKYLISVLMIAIAAACVYLLAATPYLSGEPQIITKNVTEVIWVGSNYTEKLLLFSLAVGAGMISVATLVIAVDAGRNLVAHLRLFAGTVFTLLVGAVRRGTRLAVAMDARGFDAVGPRTIARPQVVRRSDVAVVLGAFAVLVAAALASSALGTFRPFWA